MLTELFYVDGRTDGLTWRSCLEIFFFAILQTAPNIVHVTSLTELRSLYCTRYLHKTCPGSRFRCSVRLAYVQIFPTTNVVTWEKFNVLRRVKKYTRCLKTYVTNFSWVFPNPHLSKKKIPINMGPKMNRYRDIDFFVEIREMLWLTFQPHSTPIPEWLFPWEVDRP
jgi:hypothetical protein